MTDKKLVVQHNKIIEAKYKLSIGEQRLIKVLVSMIEPDDEDLKTYEISVSDLVSILGLTNKDSYRRVKTWSQKLIGNVLIFKDGKGDDCDELQVSWLSSARYNKTRGSVSLRFDPSLKPLLLHLKSHFTMYELGNVIRLKHVYSIRIYELLKQYEKIGRRRFTVEELREMLMLEDNEYSQFRDFRRWVLTPAKNEISEKTDISFTWEETKVRRNCVSVEFSIKSRKHADSKTEAKLKENELVGLLVGFGVTRRTADGLVGKYEEGHIRGAIAYTQALLNEGKVNNPAGFLVEAIKNEYRDNHAEERERQEEKTRKDKEQQSRALRYERLRDAYTEAKNAAFLVWRGGLETSEVEQHRTAHERTLHAIIRNHKKRDVVESMFSGYLKKLMPFPTLAEWATENSWDVAEFVEELAQEGRGSGTIPAGTGTVA